MCQTDGTWSVPSHKCTCDTEFAELKAQVETQWIDQRTVVCLGETPVLKSEFFDKIVEKAGGLQNVGGVVSSENAVVDSDGLGEGVEESVQENVQTSVGNDNGEANSVVSPGNTEASVGDDNLGEGEGNDSGSDTGTNQNDSDRDGSGTESSSNSTKFYKYFSAIFTIFFMNM